MEQNARPASWGTTFTSLGLLAALVAWFTGYTPGLLARTFQTPRVQTPGYAMSGSRGPLAGVGPSARLVATEPSRQLAAADPASKPQAKPQDITPPGTPAAPRKATGGLIGTLRDQVEQSTILEESGSTEGLLESLDRAATIFEDAKRRNREALDRLNRRTSHTTSRARPSGVVIVLERCDPARVLDPNLGERVPALARWRSTGLHFTQAYTASSDPETAWWSLLTGRNTGRLVPGTARTATLPPRDGLPSRLWKSGYTTAMLGDWPRNDHPLDHGFEYWCGFDRASPPAPCPTHLAVGRSRMEIPANRDGLTGVTWQELLTIETRQWLRTLGSSNRPGWLLVRLPVVVPDQTAPESTMTVPAATWSAWNEYFANVQHALAETELEDRVSVIITALAGEASREDGLSERELRVPLVMTGAGVRDPGRGIETPIATWDLPATWADLAGIADSTDGQDGVSLRPWLTGTGATEPRLFYWRSAEHPEDQAVRRVQWKGIYTGKTRSLRLYDLASDPRETENVASRHPDVVRSLLKGAPEAVEATVRRLDQPPRD